MGRLRRNCAQNQENLLSYFPANESESRLRILVDGMNLSLPAGTGIATYGRNFTETTKQLGYAVDFVVGGHRLDGQSSRNVEQWLAAAAPTSTRRPFGSVRRLMGAIRTAVMPNVAPLEVLAGPTCASRMFHVEELFANAFSAFRHFGHMTELTIPDIDIAHWTAPAPIRLKGAINVYTIHDLIPLTHPELVLGASRQFRRLCQAISQSADHILTVSESSRRDVIEQIGCPPSIVTNTYQTIEASFWSGAGPRDCDAPDGFVHRGYFLFFGAIEPKKNLARILEAHDDPRIRLPLVIVGSPGWGCNDVLERLKAASDSRDGRLVVLKPLSRELLAGLIRSARATVFSSIYEGFGLPALESLALGTPVIGSTAGSLPEVIGPGGLLVDPSSVPDIRDAMLRVQHDDRLCQRLAEDGRTHVTKFSPDVYRARLGAILQSLAAR